MNEVRVKYKVNKFCKDCHKQLSDYRSIRCKSCAKTGKLSSNYIDGRTNKTYYCKDCGKVLKLYTAKRCKKCSEKFFKYLIHKHHNNLNKHNNNEENLLYLKIGKHEQLHKFAYNYLIKTNQIESYIEWFISEFNPKLYTKKEYYKSKEY